MDKKIIAILSLNDAEWLTLNKARKLIDDIIFEIDNNTSLEEDLKETLEYIYEKLNEILEY